MRKERKRQTCFIIPRNMSTALPLVSTAVPLVGRVLPRMGAEIPLISKKIGLVSARIPLVSAHIPKTLPRHWGFLPSRHWGRTGLPTERRQRVKRPTDIGLTRFLGKVITAPIQPVVMVGEIGRVVVRQVGRRLKSDKQKALLKELEELKKKEGGVNHR